MEVEGQLDPILDYAIFQISYKDNSYEALACVGGNIEKLSCGVLDHLVQHLPLAKEFMSNPTGESFKLQPTESDKGSHWFTRFTLIRFLQIVNTPEVLISCNTTENKLSELENTRSYRLASQTKGHLANSVRVCRSGDIANLASLAQNIEVETIYNATKNRLPGVREMRWKEQFVPINQAVGGTLSFKQTSDLIAFTEHFGAKNLRSILSGYLSIILKDHLPDSQARKKSNNPVNNYEDMPKDSFLFENKSCREEPAHPSETIEMAVRCLRVQDAIKLFESKQHDRQIAIKKSSEGPFSYNKTVLGGWTSSTCSTLSHSQEIASDMTSVRTSVNLIQPAEESNTTEISGKSNEIAGTIQVTESPGDEKTTSSTSRPAELTALNDEVINNGETTNYLQNKSELENTLLKVTESNQGLTAGSDKNQNTVKLRKQVRSLQSAHVNGHSKIAAEMKLPKKTAETKSEMASKTDLPNSSQSSKRNTTKSMLPIKDVPSRKLSEKQSSLPTMHARKPNEMQHPRTLNKVTSISAATDQRVSKIKYTPAHPNSKNERPLYPPTRKEEKKQKGTKKKH